MVISPTHEPSSSHKTCTPIWLLGSHSLNPNKINARSATYGDNHPRNRFPIATQKTQHHRQAHQNGNHSPLAYTSANTDVRPTKHRTYDIVVRDTPDPRRKIGILSMKPDTPSHIMINVKPLHAIIISHVGLVTVARSLATRKPTPKWHRNMNYVISFVRHTSH